VHPGPRPEALMPKIDLPLLLLWGEKDPWTPANGPVMKDFRQALLLSCGLLTGSVVLWWPKASMNN